MNKKISIILLVLFTAMCVLGVAACKDKGKVYTVTWKNFDGEVLETDSDVKEGTVPTFDGATPAKQGDEQYSYVFAGWEPAISEVHEDATYTATYTAIDNRYKATWKDDNTIQYGLYPQTHVSDEVVIAELNKLTPTEINGWYLYEDEYFAKYTATVYNNESYAFDDGTAIVNGNEYWFKCEPIEWKVLNGSNGTYYVLSCKLLDAHNYHADYSPRTSGGETVYANNYAQSGIRNWLNDYFFNTAFALNDTYIQAANVDNGASTTDAATNSYACANTQDKIYLPSYSDYLNADYGFATIAEDTSATRECKTTDYARARGAWYNTQTKLLYNGSYWMRSPSSEYYYCAWNVNSGGVLSAYAVDGDSHCVRPCISVYMAQ